RIGERCTVLRAGWWRVNQGRRINVADPDEAASRFVVHLRVGKEEFIFEIAEGVFVQLKLPLESPISHTPTPLEHVEGLVQDLLKSHPYPSRCPWYWVSIPSLAGRHFQLSHALKELA